jgi:hypothetical protein
MPPHVLRPPADERAPTRAVVAIALRQHGRISARQLAQLGWSRDVIAARVAAGWLVREHRGAYRLAGAPDTPVARSMAAILAVDPRSSTTHRSGLVLHRVLEPDEGAPVHLTTRRHHRSRAGIVVHQAALAPHEVVRIEGVRVATLVRCLVDAAATEPAAIITRAVQEAEFLRVLDPAALLASAAGRPGAALLRALASERLPIRGPLREAFERRFARFLLTRGFPLAEVNRRVDLERPAQRVVLDVVWWEAGLGVELDSRQAHATARAFEADRERDRRLAVQHDLLVVRVTWRQLHETPDAVAADLWTLHRRRVRDRRAAS